MKAFSITILATLCSLAIPAHASSIAITYSLIGGPIGPPVVAGTTLILDGLFTGSILSNDPGLNAAWNPVTYSDHSVADLTTGILNGTFNIVFANGDTLFGNVFEDVSAVVATGTGPYTQTLTFTGGTGDFAGATGSASGAGSTEGPVSGSGILNAPAVPEPASVALLLGGLTLIRLRRSRIMASVSRSRH
ncbi:MAG TPA: PEP-CTERM sorting domain-containing protein [Bryobacteraceae bacterium]|jgi:hypothetical protein